MPDDAVEKGCDFAPWLGRHGPDVTDSIISATIKALREEFGVEKIGAVGYCFGGRYVMRFLAKGKGIDAGFAAHPSLVQANEFEEIDGPLSLAIAGERFISEGVEL